MSPNKSCYPAFRACALTVCLASLLVGCASVPDSRVDEAGAAVDAAADEGVMVATPPPTAPGKKLTLKDGHPERYTVRKGDTLWGISERFLDDPWLWPELWQLNPEIRNPHLIYPGDVLGLTLGADGKPRLQIERRARPVVKLSPQIRERSIADAIPPIPLDAIRAFVNKSAVLPPAEWETLPYVVAQNDGLIIGANERFYGRGLELDAQQVYGVFRPDEMFVDPLTGENLGQAGLYVGMARLERAGDPATLMMESGERQGYPGDRLYPLSEEYPTQFVPSAGAVNGLIIAVLDGVTQIGRYQNVVINRGQLDGAEAGEVLGVLRTGDVVTDPLTKAAVKLPDERSGLVLIYRVFDRISYALVMRATRSMHVGDKVVPPDLAPN